MARARYAVVIERGPTSYGAHVPDLPGCVAAAETKAEVCVLIREVIELYLEALEEDGNPIPAPQAYELIEVQASGTAHRQVQCLPTRPEMADSSAGRAPDSHWGGRGFESHSVHQISRDHDLAC